MAANAFTVSGGSAGSPAKLAHAELEVHKPGNTAGAPQKTIAFQFNPKELAVTKTAKWKRDGQPKAKKSALPTFTGSDPLKLTIEMFLDATDTMNTSVVQRVEELFTCCVPTPETVDTKTPSTPWVVLHWGDLRGFTAVVTNVNAKYTLFTPGGTPVRAVCSVTLEEMPTEVAKQNPTSGSLVVRDVHQVVAGDTLESLAYRTYGDPNLWREIAHANDIDDPMRLRPGRALLLPAPEELEPGRRHGE